MPPDSPATYRDATADDVEAPDVVADVQKPVEDALRPIRSDARDSARVDVDVAEDGESRRHKKSRLLPAREVLRLLTMLKVR
jgi:hypothetical protein